MCLIVLCNSNGIVSFELNMDINKKTFRYICLKKNIKIIYVNAVWYRNPERIRRFRAENIYVKNVLRSRRPVATDVDNIIFVIFAAKF